VRLEFVPDSSFDAVSLYLGNMPLITLGLEIRHDLMMRNMNAAAGEISIVMMFLL